MNLKSYFLSHFYEYLKKSSSFIIIIIMIDLLPLIAVIWSGWSAIEALYLYALETIILLWIALRKMWRSKYTLALFVNQAQNVADNIAEHTQSLNINLKKRSFSWILKGARGLLYFIFTLLWIPLIILQLMIIASVSGDGFRFWGFIEHNSGNLNLGFISLDLLLVFLVLLFLEHTYAYRNKYIKEKEYENTGLINEGLSFTIRVFIQQFLIIGLFALIGWMHIDTISMVLIMIFKIIIDIISYLFNRVWGGLKNKMEGQGKG